MTLAEDYDYEVLATAKWLSEQHAIRISCWQVTLARDTVTSQDYLNCVQVFPHKKLEALAIQRAVRMTEAAQTKTIEQLLETCENQDEKDFFSKRLEQLRNGKGDALKYSVSGTGRWYPKPRRTSASVFQFGRFDGDLALWQKLLSNQSAISVLNRKPSALRFSLVTASDFENFQHFVDHEASKLTWKTQSEDGDKALSATT